MPHFLRSFGLFVSILAISGCGGGAPSKDVVESSKHYEQTVAEARKLGLWTSTQDVIADAKGGASVEAGRKLKAALMSFESAISKEGFCIDHGGRIGPPTKLEFADPHDLSGRPLPRDWSGVYSSIGNVLDEIKQSAKTEKVDFERNLDHEILKYIGPPEYQTIRGAISLLCLRAVANAKIKNFALALSDLSSAARLGTICGSEPIIEGLSLEASSQDRIFKAWAECASYAGAKDNFAEKTLVSLNPNLKSRTVERMISIELISEFQLIDRIAKSDSSWRQNRKDFSGLGIKGLNEADAETAKRGFEVQAMRFAIDFTKIANSGSGQDALSQFEKRRPKEREKWVPGEIFGGTPDWMMRMILQSRPQRACFDVALLIFRLKERSGAFPDTLPLEAGNKLDPMTGQPFKYQKEAGGVVIYSEFLSLKENHVSIKFSDKKRPGEISIRLKSL